MIILPAIDLYDKKAVRLFKGDYSKMTIYSDFPLSVAMDFKKSGAEWIHLVDLEGARDGTTPNIDIITEIADKSGLKTEVGGGIRSLSTVEKYLSAGVSRVILGTAAVTDNDFLIEAVKKHGEQIAVGVDIKDGFVAIKGWKEKSALTADDFFSRLEAIGVKIVICTDISKDGAMKGTNTLLYKSISERFNIQLIASGGVSSVDDIISLNSLGIYGAIVGKAYYIGAIDLYKACEVAE